VYLEPVDSPLTRDSAANEKQVNFTNNWFSITAKPIWDILVPQVSPRTILEIGSFEGASACYLIENCASKFPIELHCIDTWEGGVEHQKLGMSAVEKRFHENIDIVQRRAQNKVSLSIHKGRSDRCLIKLLGDGLYEHFDFIYIDGSHQAQDVLSDAVFSFNLLKVGGTMVFDDYLWRLNDCLQTPKPAIDAFMNIYFHKMQVSCFRNSQAVAKKTAS
jgi:predicted O-methyltransferase YrrM